MPDYEGGDGLPDNFEDYEKRYMRPGYVHYIDGSKSVIKDKLARSPGGFVGGYYNVTKTGNVVTESYSMPMFLKLLEGAPFYLTKDGQELYDLLSTRKFSKYDYANRYLKNTVLYLRTGNASPENPYGLEKHVFLHIFKDKLFGSKTKVSTKIERINEDNIRLSPWDLYWGTKDQIKQDKQMPSYIKKRIDHLPDLQNNLWSEIGEYLQRRRKKSSKQKRRKKSSKQKRKSKSRKSRVVRRAGI